MQNADIKIVIFIAWSYQDQSKGEERVPQLVHGHALGDITNKQAPRGVGIHLITPSRTAATATSRPGICGGRSEGS